VTVHALSRLRILDLMSGPLHSTTTSGKMHSGKVNKLVLDQTPSVLVIETTSDASTVTNASYVVPKQVQCM
jgi:hypothetical protein